VSGLVAASLPGMGHEMPWGANLQSLLRMMTAPAKRAEHMDQLSVEPRGHAGHSDRRPGRVA